MADDSFVENTVRYRDGRKWKERWCVLKKPSPVADCLSVMLYKDANKQVLKSKLILDEFCGIDTTPFDGEKFILSIICCKKTLFLSFDTENLRHLWKQKLLFNFGKDICFKVEFTKGLPDQTFSATNFSLNHSCICNLFLTSSRMSLTSTEASNIVLRHLYSWRYMDLKRHGSLGNNSYGIQVLFKGGEMNFVFKTYQIVEIDKALKSKMQSLQQSHGLFEQLICSISVPCQSTFSASSSNPSTPTYCISSESSKLINNDRRFSSPHSQMSMKSPVFCNSFDNTLHQPHTGKQILSSSNVSFSGSNLPELPYKSLLRHFSECNLHLPFTPSDHRMPDVSLNSSGSCENSIENCLESNGMNLNYINYDATSKSMTDSESVSLIPFLKEDNKCKSQVVPPTLVSSPEKSSSEIEHASEGLPNNEFSYTESLANVAMMNGGHCANKMITFDPLQPLPYRDLSQYDGESDEGYLYYLPGSPGNLKKSSGYINISSAVEAKENNNFFFKSKKSVEVEEYLKPDMSLDNSNKLKVECCNGSTMLNENTSNYVNVSGADTTKVVSVTSLANSGRIGEILFLEDIRNSDQTTYINDYIPINQLTSGMKDNFVKIENNEVKSLACDYLDKAGKGESEKHLDANPISKTLDISEKTNNASLQNDVYEVQFEKCEISCDENVDDLMKKIHMSPPPPSLTSQHLESQDYINLSSTSVGEPVICLNPPPRPPKLLNCIKEDASEYSSPPPLPEKAKHLRVNMDQDLAPLPIPIRRRDQSIASDLFPKPPLPRRTCNSPINLHSSPPPGVLHYNRSSAVPCFSGIHFGGRPLSASSLSKHRKPNLTVDIKNTYEIDQGKMDTPTSITSKWQLDDLNRSMPALAIYKPRNGKEYVDRRRLAEESFAPSLPPHSAQRSPSVASSVFTFDEKSVASNHHSGWYSSGEDSPKYPPNAASSVGSSIRGKFDQKWSLGHSHHEMYCNGSPCSYHFEGVDSPRTFSTGKVINYADIDLLPGDFCMDQSKYKFAVTSSPPSTPDNKTVYAKIDVAATSAVSKVGKHHAKQREDTLEKRGENAIFTKFQSCEGNIEKRKLSLDMRKQSSLSIKD